MIRRPPRSTLSSSSAASDVYKRQLDIVNAVANTAENILDGYNRTIEVDDFEKCFLTDKANDTICLDVRGPANAAPYVDLFGPRWLNIPQETLKHRFAEIPPD